MDVINYLSLKIDILHLPAAVGFYKPHIKIRKHTAAFEREFIGNGVTHIGFK